MRGRPRKDGVVQDNNPDTFDPIDAFNTDEFARDELPPLEEENAGTVTIIEEKHVTVQEPPLPLMPHGASQDELFGKPVETDNNIKSVSKELFSKGDIDLKTEVSHDEINNLTRIRFLQEKFKVGRNGNLDHIIDSFLRLRVSKDRKSRGEFIAALQTENKSSQGGSLWDRLTGRGPG